MWEITGTLVVMAEVKIPLRKLPEEDHPKLVHEVYKTLVSPKESALGKDFGKKAVGEVDTYFAGQIVVLKETEANHFTLSCMKEVILAFGLGDVMFIGAVEGCISRVIFVARSQNFGRVAVVLQMETPEDAVKVREKIGHNKNQCKSESQEKSSSTSSNQSVIMKLTNLLSPPSKPETTPPKDSQQVGYYEVVESSDEDNWYEPTLDRDTVQTPVTAKISTTSVPDIQAQIEAEINYILTTEDTYVKLLNTLEERRKDLAANSDTPKFVIKWLSQLFRQVKSLETTHESLLQSLVEAKYDITKFSEAFVIHEKQFRFYVYYIENIPTVERILNSEDCSPYFKEKMPELREKLRQPRLRLNHYVLMLESLYKKVDSQNQTALQKAIDMCKSYLKEADQALFLSTIKNCPSSMQKSTWGNLIHMSELQLVSSPDLPRKYFTLVLFEKKLLLARGDRDDLEFVRCFPLDEIILNTNIRGLIFSFAVNNGEGNLANKIYAFKAKNVKAQHEWVVKLKEAINTVKITLVRSNTRVSFGASTASKLRRKLATPRIKITNPTENDSESDDDVCASKQYWINRRKNKYKKFSSNRELKTFHTKISGSLSDGEETSNIRHGMAPLTVWSFFQKFEVVYKLLRRDSGESSKSTDFGWVSDEKNYGPNMNVVELNYIEGLREQLGRLLDPNVAKPPKQIQKDLRRIYQLHIEKIKPAFDEVEAMELETEFLRTITRHGEDISSVYCDFLINRCTYHDEILDMCLEDKCIKPIDHFLKYCTNVILMQEDRGFDDALINTAAEVLHHTITAANNYLMAECINNVPFALSTCEPILLVSKMKVKIDNRSKNECQVVLVKDQLFILEIVPPLYNYICTLRLDSVSLGPMTNRFQFELELSVSSAVRRTYSFRAQNEQIVLQWTNEIRRILFSQAENLKKSVQQRLDEAPTLQVGVHNLHLDVARSPSMPKKNSFFHVDLKETNL
ncbi:uncharacterized protein LOC108671093 [Hyalella azteca]|uniref:Uncharacterized protein LOC108671093 n=1 Tax=Hyalella azteca TaxID=294128 RepID=A0A8B7NK82_HYAAZ|nr:uncharacterized protein LOC108671093 [Hyalella azteca]